METQDTAPLNRIFRMAVVAGVESAVQIHIDRGDNLNARDDKGQTPLMLSAARNRALICKLLLAAGADPKLIDPLGRDALSIAQASGAIEAASAIAEVCTPRTLLEGVSCSPTHALLDEVTAPTADYPSTAPPIDADREQSTGLTAVSVPVLVDLDADGAEFDLSEWEAEIELPPPEADATLSLVSLAIQSSISEHDPIDTSADWSDFEAFLPEKSTPLPRADDAEACERLRLVFLRAIREGSVPDTLIDDLARSEDGEPDQEAGALLRMVINDLGAETDERFEYLAPHENFVVFVAPEEKTYEEEAIDEAVAFVNELVEHRNDPLRIYQREFQGEALLTAETEVALGQGMELSVEKALDALASWPEGIAKVLGAAKTVASGAKPLRWLSAGPPVGMLNTETKSSAEHDAEFPSDDTSDSQFDLDAKESLNELGDFQVNAQLLSGLTIGANQDDPKWTTCRGAIASLGLTRGFLMELADSELDETMDPALAFRQAIKVFRRARDRMIVANLKLVLSISKKYLFTGQPLDDLLQEGNIGLIKAVDRYDWRRGFKFSTYATWWIRQQVGRYAADKCKTIRLPVHVYEKTQRIALAARTFEFTNGRAPTTEEVTKMVGLPIKKVLALNRASMEPMPIHEIDELDDSIAVDAKDEYAARDPMSIVEDTQLIGIVDQLLGTFKPKEARVLRMRFGIGIQDFFTLEEIGVRLDLTRERIRQIEAHALRTLKNPSRIDKLLRELNGAPSPQNDKALKGSDDEVGSVAAVDPANMSPQLAAQARLRTTRPDGPGPTALDKLLDHARAIGFHVEDSPEGPDQKIWVHITETPDNNSRKIVRKLIELGFVFWPGKGYWR